MKLVSAPLAAPTAAPETERAQAPARPRRSSSGSRPRWRPAPRSGGGPAGPATGGSRRACHVDRRHGPGLDMRILAQHAAHLGASSRSPSCTCSGGSSDQRRPRRCAGGLDQHPGGGRARARDAPPAAAPAPARAPHSPACSSAARVAGNTTATRASGRTSSAARSSHSARLSFTSWWATPLLLVGGQLARPHRLERRVADHQVERTGGRWPPGARPPATTWKRPAKPVGLHPAGQPARPGALHLDPHALAPPDRGPAAGTTAPRCRSRCPGSCP